MLLLFDYVRVSSRVGDRVRVSSRVSSMVSSRVRVSSRVSGRVRLVVGLVAGLVVEWNNLRPPFGGLPVKSYTSLSAIVNLTGRLSSTQPEL